MPDAPALVVKLGGSLYASPQRAQWLDALRLYPGPMTLVCGGGPFADAVRAAQPAMGYDDRAAHAMALRAMEQYALALAALHEELVLASTLAEIAAAQARRRIALWLPSTMVAAAPDITPGWDVTSDSLAAWLARTLGAKALLVIKSVDVGAEFVLADLVKAGVVDPAFPVHVDATPVAIAGPDALRGAASLLARGILPGARADALSRKIAS